MRLLIPHCAHITNVRVHKAMLARAMNVVRLVTMNVMVSVNAYKQSTVRLCASWANYLPTITPPAASRTLQK